ncbi:MAG: hypothetical protein LUG18_08540 [Candidatus Azobacteroides sp.]|nr:hypothetical protein [Candidatus Azobacteroides sp.]
MKKRIRLILEFLVKNKLHAELIKLQETDKFLDFPKNVLSLVGEIGKGKSTIANNLLDEDIFPVYMFEPLCISVDNGEPNNLIKMKEGSVRSLPQNINFDLLSGQSYSEITLFRNNDFLRVNNLRLIDGYDINSNHTIPCVLSDMVIFVMSANALLSINEKNMIDSISEQKIKNLLLCITHIDQVKPEETEKIVKLIALHYPDLPVVYTSNDKSYHPESPIREKYGIGKIAKFITDFCEKDVNPEQRFALVNYQLNKIILSAIEKLEQRKLEFENAKAEKFSNYKIRVENVKFQQLAWEDTRIEYEKRENECMEFIQSELNLAKNRIAERLCQKLDISSNPKEWWGKNLPYEIRSEISNLTIGIDSKLQSKIIADYNWLIKEVQTKFKQSLEGSIPKQETEIEYQIQPDADSLKNLRTIKYVSMASAGALATTMYFVVGPVGMLISAACGILSDKYLNKVIDNQKKELKNALIGLVDEIIGKISSLIPVRVHEIYDEFVEKTEVEEVEWIKLRKIETFDCEETEKIKKVDEAIQEIHLLLNLN